MAPVRFFVFLTAVAVAAIWIGVEHRFETAQAEPILTARPQEIQSIALDGRGLPLTSLHAVLATHVGDVVDKAKLARDRSALEQALNAQGYLAAQVRDAQIVVADNGAAFVTFPITQGPQFHVRSVKVSGASERDAGVVTLAAGDIALAERITYARDALAERLSVRGKQNVVDANISRDLSAAAVDVELVAR